MSLSLHENTFSCVSGTAQKITTTRKFNCPERDLSYVHLFGSLTVHVAAGGGSNIWDQWDSLTLITEDTSIYSRISEAEVVD